MTLPEGMPESSGRRTRRRRSSGRARTTSRSSAACSTSVTGTRAQGDHRAVPRSRARRCCRCCTWCSRKRATSARTASRSARTRWSSPRPRSAAVATFYTMYKRRPTGELPGQRVHQHHVRRARRRRHLRPARSSARRLRLGHEETRPTGRSRWSTPSAWPPATTRPVIQVNYEYYDNQTVDTAERLVDAAAARRASRTPRGARRSRFRTVELELAGIFPGSAPPGVGGLSEAPETLLGVTDRRASAAWAAPAMPDTPPALPEARNA